MYPWFKERPDLTQEVRSFMNNDSLTVYEDEPHRCFHVFMGADEFTSVLAPWGDQSRESLRRIAYIAHNGLSDSEFKASKDSHAKFESDGDKYQDDVVDDMVRNVSNYTHDKKLYFTTPGE